MAFSSSSNTLQPFRQPQTSKVHLAHARFEISINQRDSWLLMHDAALLIDGKLEITEGDGEAALINNFGAFLFDRISYEINGKEIDGIRDPGLPQTGAFLIRCCYWLHDDDGASCKHPADKKPNALNMEKAIATPCYSTRPL
ncbi:unnamed protein product [Brassicogethes aeneus]|uniref:Uncharacterized protein n=1 Tax=Brassicogethes aeneus TaxID=1431903 RepID=A0A9P0ARC6_BRAAE|nr:unnamed protein product [Brassicogethes aeneus]